MAEIRVQDEQGNIHVFPEEATPEMIAGALNVKPPGISAPEGTPQLQQPVQPQSSLLDKMLGFAGQYPGGAFNTNTGLDVGPRKDITPLPPAMAQQRTTDQMVKAGQMIMGGGGLKNVASTAADLLPNAARAGQSFKAASQVAGADPVAVQAAGKAALEAQTLKDTVGRTVPRVMQKFLQRTTAPNSAPLTYDEARQFYSAAGELSANEKTAITPNVRRLLNEFRVQLGNSIQQTADTAGVGDQLKSGMTEYRRAKQIEDFTDMLKKNAVNVAKAGVPTAIGGAAAGYAAKKILGGR